MSDTENTFVNFAPIEAKWQPILDLQECAPIQDSWKRKVVAVCLDNTAKEWRNTPQRERVNLHEDLQSMDAGTLNENMVSGNLGGPTVSAQAGGVLGYDPVLIGMVRRSMPNLMAYDVCGVQPMTAPTGLIFSLRSKYGSNAYSTAAEAQFQEADPRYSGSGGNSGYGQNNVPQGGLTMAASVTPYSPSVSGSTWATQFIDGRGSGGTNNYGFQAFRAMMTGIGETLAINGSPAMNQMSFTIDRFPVVAGTRALASAYTTELAQDLKAVHGLDTETELANLLSTELLAEQNREILRTIYQVARTGSQQADLTYVANSQGGGIYDLNSDSDGRWSAERWRGMYFQIDRENNWIAKETRRGKGNVLITSSDVAAALAQAGFLLISPAINTQLEVDDTGNTFCGLLNNKTRVYVDPYSTTGANFWVNCYKGANPMDAGLFLCPYVPLQMARAIDPDTLQPRIGMKMRYGVCANPFVLNGNTPDGQSLTFGLNQYYRMTQVIGLHGNAASGV